MDVATFPLMSADARLDAALHTMRRGHFGGVVIRRSDVDLRLAETAQVRTSIDAGRQVLGQIEGTVPVVRLALDRLAARQADLVEPYRTVGAYEALLDEQHAEYGLVAAGPEHAIVVSRYETLMLTFRNGPQDCYCVPNKHSNQGPPPPAGCRRCGSPVRCDAP